jgi:hypothetical protein
MSVSVPFFIPSVHVGAWHLPFVHTPFWQSASVVQVLLVPHRLQVVLPPQSTSLSAPFFTPSPQLGA